MTGIDGIADLSHDHAELNRRALAIAVLLQKPQHVGLAEKLGELRDLLFMHFAREEEGLFPFVAERVPALADSVHAMAVAHDTICGALSRACHLAVVGSDRAQLVAIYDRFEHAYAIHARAEAELLSTLGQSFTPEDRSRLAELVDGL